MNLKPNLWTLLFALSLLLWGYNYTQKDYHSPKMEVELGPYEISAKDFKEWRKEYLNQVKPCLDSCTAIPYTGPKYFKIDWAELSALYHQDSAKNLYIIPIVEKLNSAKDAKSISLAFSTATPGDTILITGKIFNFATPCPPLCEEEG